MRLASGSQPREEVPADIPDDLDDEFSREFNVWIVELWRELHPQFSCLFDQPRSCLLAKTAQSFAHDLGVHGPLGHWLSLEIGPDIGATRLFSGEHMVEGA